MRWLQKHPELNPNPKLPIPPKKELEEKYSEKRLSTWDLAKQYGVSQTQIRRWFLYLNIPRRPYKENKMPVKKGSSHSWGRKISQKMIGNKNSRTGANHWNWRGGITPLGFRLRNSRMYKRWRESIFKRDNYICQMCGKTNCYLEADHIKPFSLFKTLRFRVDNGRTLCKDCHQRYGWQFFKEMNPRKKKTI